MDSERHFPYVVLWCMQCHHMLTYCGLSEYVYVKPVLAAVTLILKASGVYNEGNLTAASGYLWVSVIYNISICIALYCLAIFWVCINDDIKPFRYEIALFREGSAEFLICSYSQAGSQILMRERHSFL